MNKKEYNKLEYRSSEYKEQLLDKWAEQKKKWRENNREKLREYDRNYKKNKIERIERISKWGKSIDGRFAQYKRDAKKRGYEFTISKEYFAGIKNSEECHYCGNGGDMGIDRKNNEMGYVEGNIVSCCKICNRFKGRKSYEYFIEMCIKIASNIKN